jgi:hypothetical protein
LWKSPQPACSPYRNLTLKSNVSLKSLEEEGYRGFSATTTNEKLKTTKKRLRTKNKKSLEFVEKWGLVYPLPFSSLPKY